MPAPASNQQHPTKPVPAGTGHPAVQRFRDLRTNRRPNPHLGVALEGLWALGHAVDAGLEIEAVFVCRALLRGPASEALVGRVAARGAPVFDVSERVLRRMVDRDGPDGLAAVARLRRWSLGAIPVRRASRFLVADNVELPGNLGTIVRCGDGAGAGAVLLTERRVRLTHPGVVKASMGTIFTMPVASGSAEEVFEWLRGHAVTIVAAHPDASVSYRAVAYEPPVAIVVGSERYGLSPFWREHADVVVSIPMLGTADSLNVGHAAALLLYEALAGASRGSSAPREWP